MLVIPMSPGHVKTLETLQDVIFPTLAVEERLRAAQYLRHLEVFPEGQFVLTIGTNSDVIGMTTTQRMDFDFIHYKHSFSETSGGGWLSRHDPKGSWLYGLDMGILPAFRGRGGARLLYRARQLLVNRLGLAGQLTVGMMNGYGAVSGEMSGDEYYRQWLEGRREDPTLTPQRTIGFRPQGLIPDYLHDPGCGNYGVLLRLDADVIV
ncbi:MAG: nitrilase [Bacteroidetes bacterium]|nr:nitrilase [Bacteroidota bacterium]